jgi:hypothetical protein
VVGVVHVDERGQVARLADDPLPLRLHEDWLGQVAEHVGLPLRVHHVGVSGQGVERREPLRLHEADRRLPPQQSAGPVEVRLVGVGAGVGEHPPGFLDGQLVGGHALFYRSRAKVGHSPFARGR